MVAAIQIKVCGLTSLVDADAADEVGAETGRRRFVAGALGPTSRTASLSVGIDRLTRIAWNCRSRSRSRTTSGPRV